MTIALFTILITIIVQIIYSHFILRYFTLKSNIIRYNHKYGIAYQTEHGQRLDEEQLIHEAILITRDLSAEAKILSTLKIYKLVGLSQKLKETSNNLIGISNLYGTETKNQREVNQLYKEIESLLNLDNNWI